MPYVVRSLAWHWSPLCAAAGLLCACPAATPHPDATGSRGAPVQAAARVEPPATPVPAVVPTAPAVEPAVEPEADPSALELPPALAAPDVRPVVQSLWRALEGVDAGDADAMGRVMVDGGRWFPPGSPEESVGTGADLRRAMGPWSSHTLDVELRRVIDLGASPVFAQLSVADREQPELRYELALMIDVRGDRIAAVHHYGDPLGPVRVGPSAEEPLDLGPVALVVEGGAPSVAHADAVGRLRDALDGRDEAAARALLDEGVVLHDVVARRTRRGPEGYLAGFRELLGEAGHLKVSQLEAGESFVVMVGVIDGRSKNADGQPMEHGFADVHRLVGRKVVETWHYVNRRGRAQPPTLRP